MARTLPRTFHDKSGTAITIRDVEAIEAATLLEYLLLIDQSSEHRLMEPGERGTSVPEQREWLEHKLDRPRSLAIGAFESTELVGFLNFRGTNRRRNAHQGSFGLSVHPRSRRRGIGAELVRSLLGWAAASPDIEQVRLDVFESNIAGRALYEQMGFREECRRMREFKLGPGHYVDAIEMSIWVKPV